MTRNRMHSLALLLGAVLVLAGPAAAGAAPAREDQIVLNLAAEGWVETETAEVVVAVNATLEEGQAATVRKTILSVLNDLAGDVDWRITTFNRTAERSGLDSWHVEAQARIADTGLDGLRDAAGEASRPGLKISVANINFTPTLAEVEATRARLRGDLYEQAQAELKRVRSAFPGREYRIGRIDFTGARVPAPDRDSRLQASRVMAEAAPAGVQVQERIRMSATVVLTTPAPRTGTSDQ